jgi:chromosome partitioning protein
MLPRVLGISTDEAALEQVTDIALRSIQNSTRIALLAVEKTGELAVMSRKPAWVVLNAYLTNSSGMMADARTALTKAGMAIAPVAVAQRVAFMHAMNDGRGVVEFEPERRAAVEITALITWAFTQIDLKKGQDAWVRPSALASPRT